jgi:hypothetical protein
MMFALGWLAMAVSYRGLEGRKVNLIGGSSDGAASAGLAGAGIAWSE